jgi:hypothetical protein
MKVLALTVAIKAGRPVVDAVAVQGSADSPDVIAAFQLPSNAADELPTQIHDVATAIRSRINGLQPDRVVIRQADFGPVARRSSGPRTRLLTEGAIVAVSLDEISDVVLLDGHALANQAFGEPKEVMDSRATALIPETVKAVAGAAVAGLAI